MATDELLPPACAFALSVLAERDQDPDAVPEEAVEAAERHMATCERCLKSPARGISTSSTSEPTRKKKRARRAAETGYAAKSSTQTFPGEPASLETLAQDSASLLISDNDSAPLSRAHVPETQARPPLDGLHSSSATQDTPGFLSPSTPPDLSAQPAQRGTLPSQPGMTLPTIPTGTTMGAQTPLLEAVDSPLDCLQCRQVLREYAEAMDSGQNVALLYPEVQEHLLSCESGCLVLLDLFRQEAKANRKNRRRAVHNPLSVIGWEMTGFFRGGIVPISPRALAYGTLILLLFVASLIAYLSIRWDDTRYAIPNKHILPTPDGIGLSDGLHIYDACNTSSYQYKREAAQAMQQGDFSRADSLLASATNVVATDTTGCNGAEAAIYREDLHVRQSGRPFGLMVISFDSGPGDANPTGGTDRHILYAAYTQELVGAFIGQQQYNSTQMQVQGAPLLYLVLANTTGVEQGALQIANSIAALSRASNLEQPDLLAKSKAPLLAVLGLGPSSLVQVVLPVLCRAGVPLIVPTATGLFIVDLLTQTSLYRHCTPGFAFVRFSPDDARQSELGATYAYNQLHVRNVAIFYDPSNPSSSGSALAFSNSFRGYKNARIIARETAVASGLLDGNGRPQASREDLLSGLTDALQSRPQLDLIFAPLLTNDVVTLAQSIARLPQNQQPVLMIGGEFVQPAALQGLVQWARQQQVNLPRIFVSLSSVARPPTNGDWQKQFYATFCTSFATPGSFCSGAAALDQGALFFGDGVEIVAKGVGPIANAGQFPTTAQMVQRISKERFAGVSCPIAFHLWDDVLITSLRVLPVILDIQEDGSFQVVG